MPNYISYPEERRSNGWKWAFFILLLAALIGAGWWLWKDRQGEDTEPTPTPTASFTPTPSVTVTASPGTSPRVTATATPASAADQAQKNAQIEALLVSYTNAERAKNGLPALKSNTTLTALAKNHSNDMAKNNFFGHTSSTGKDPWQRASEAGVVIAAENIAKMGLGNVQGIGLVQNTPESVAQAQFKVWMGSEGHRQNILSSSVTELGIGTAFDGAFYLTTQIYR